MIYLDYSATTKVDKDVLDEFIKYSDKTYNVDNINELKLEVQNILNTSMEVIFTSGSTESNNLAISGVLKKYNSGRIITTKLEHSSVKETLKYYEKQGFIIDYVNLINGVVDINHLKSLIKDDTRLVTISYVDSEVGILQPINEIGKILKEKNIIFHTDATQAIGKVDISFKNVDLVTISSHKIYGLKGASILLNNNISLEPIFYGERKLNFPLLKSFVFAIKKAISNIESDYKYVLDLHDYFISHLNKSILINSINSIPHIINTSYLNMKPETFMHSLELNDIYISTKSACSTTNDYSESVYEVTKDLKRASTSTRISISKYTKKEDLDKLIESINTIVGGFHE